MAFAKMALGLYLHGECDRLRDALLEEIADHAREAHDDVLIYSHIGVNDAGHRACWLSLHPAEENVELTLSGLTKVQVSARTSGAGPGYHAWLCELLDGLGKRFGIRWQAVDPTGASGDDTGYFHSRDRARLEDEMRAWLRGIAASLRRAELEGATGVALSMPADAPQFEVPGVVTPLGPRDAAYFAALETDDALAARFFPWWEPGAGAGYLLGRALCRMWCDVRWRKARNDDEHEVHDEVLDLLQRGFELDPQRAWPFSEWAELLAFRGETLPAGAVASGPPSIGYRRGMLVAKPYPGASIRIPGPFSEAFDKRGNWSAWEDGRTVWVSLLSAARPKPGAPLPEDQPEPTYERVDEDGETTHKVHGKRVVRAGEGLRVLFVTVLCASSRDVDWAHETYRSARLV